MNAPLLPPLDPLIAGYLSYLEKVSRKSPRTIVDVRCTLRRAVAARQNTAGLQELAKFRLSTDHQGANSARTKPRHSNCHGSAQSTESTLLLVQIPHPYEKYHPRDSRPPSRPFSRL